MGLLDGPRDKETEELARGIQLFARWIATLPDNWPVEPQDAPKGNPGHYAPTEG